MQFSGPTALQACFEDPAAAWQEAPLSSANRQLLTENWSYDEGQDPAVLAFALDPSAASPSTAEPPHRAPDLAEQPSRAASAAGSWRPSNKRRSAPASGAGATVHDAAAPRRGRPRLAPVACLAPGPHPGPPGGSPGATGRITGQHFWFHHAPRLTSTCEGWNPDKPIPSLEKAAMQELAWDRETFERVAAALQRCQVPGALTEMQWSSLRSAFL